MRKLRRIVLKHAHNLRDLGGYATQDDFVTRWHVLYRSDALNALNNDEWKFLYTNGIRTLIDLRSKAEAEDNPIVIPKEYPLIYKKCPVQSVEVELDSEELSKFTLTESMEKAYIDMFNDDVALFAKALAQIIDSMENGQVIFFCSAGKDRTGVITAMLMYLCKCYEEDIISNYEISYTLNEKGINAYLRTLKAIQHDESKLESKPENIKALLDYFKEINLEKVLAKNGINAKRMEKLRQYFLETL
ncbi:MAG: tyrosine-protein phosphatase [Clostridia bacterium]|nr:tyrosine-protein phosphatase [Clostridia bacterium]